MRQAMSVMTEKPYFVYILWSRPGCCFYSGITETAPAEKAAR